MSVLLREPQSTSDRLKITQWVLWFSCCFTLKLAANGGQSKRRLAPEETSVQGPQATSHCVMGEASTDPAPLLGDGIVCKEKCMRPAPSLAHPIWAPYLSLSDGALLVFQVRELDLCLLCSAWIYWSYSRPSARAVYPAELNQVWGGGNRQVWEERGKVGKEPLPSILPVR